MSPSQTIDDVMLLLFCFSPVFLLSFSFCGYLGGGLVLSRIDLVKHLSSRCKEYATLLQVVCEVPPRSGQSHYLPSMARISSHEMSHWTVHGPWEHQGMLPNTAAFWLALSALSP